MSRDPSSAELRIAALEQQLASALRTIEKLRKNSERIEAALNEALAREAGLSDALDELRKR